MTSEQRIPPLRDLPPGRLAARRRHLLAEIASGEGSALHRRLAAIGAAAAAAGALVVGLQLGSTSSPSRSASTPSSGRGAVPVGPCLQAPQVFYGCTSFLVLPRWTVEGGNDQ